MTGSGWSGWGWCWCCSWKRYRKLLWLLSTILSHSQLSLASCSKYSEQICFLSGSSTSLPRLTYLGWKSKKNKRYKSLVWHYVQAWMESPISSSSFLQAPKAFLHPLTAFAMLFDCLLTEKCKPIFCKTGIFSLTVTILYRGQIFSQGWFCPARTGFTSSFLHTCQDTSFEGGHLCHTG